MATRYQSRRFYGFEIILCVGLLIGIVQLHTGLMNIENDTSNKRGILTKWASSKVIDGHRKLAGNLVVEQYQGTESPIEQSIAPSPSFLSSMSPSIVPLSSMSPSNSPTTKPSNIPTISSAPSITFRPSPSPSQEPSPRPTISHPPSQQPSVFPSDFPTFIPSQYPSARPSSSPRPSVEPTILPSSSPTSTVAPSVFPSNSHEPTITASPTIWDPLRTDPPSSGPSKFLSEAPSPYPSASPSEIPSTMPSLGGDLYAEHFMTIVLDDIYEQFRPARWQQSTTNFVREFWNNRELNLYSPVFVGHVDTRYIKETRLGEVSPGIDNTSLPLAIEYQQSINYTIIIEDYDVDVWGDLHDTLFTYPFKLNQIGYMSTMVRITENPTAIFLTSYKITTPEIEEAGSPGTDAAIISILVIVVALVLLVAAFYLVHLLRKERDAQEEFIQKSDQGVLVEVDTEDDRNASPEFVESPVGSRYQGPGDPVPVTQPGHMRMDSADSNHSDQDENSNKQHRRHPSSSNIDDRSNYMSDLEGMMIDSHSTGDGDEDNMAGSSLGHPIHVRYSENQYGSQEDESDDDYDDPMHMRQTGFIMKVEAIDDEA